MNRIIAIVLWTCAAVLPAALLGGCARSGPVLLQDVLYQAPTGTAPAPSTVVIAVSPLKDVRGGSLSALGKRIIGSDVQNDLVVQGTVSDLVTAALKEALQARGVTVKDASSPGDPAGAGVLLGGEIKAFWIDVESRPLRVQSKASVLLRMTVADAAGAPAHVVNVQSALSREDVVFSFSTVQSTLSEALTAALDQLLADEEVRKRIQ